ALLRFPDLAIELLRAEGDDQRTLISLPLEGRSFAELFSALEAAVAKALESTGEIGPQGFELRRPNHELPSHRVDPNGLAEPFGRFNDHALTELTRWFGNGDRALRELAAQDPRAT